MKQKVKKHPWQKKICINKLNQSVNLADHMSVPTLVVPNQDATDNALNETDESQKAIVDANNKKRG